ncbi:Uncharacterised protein [Legionella beliardensis]|uniref:Uncharacterized protein n=1 Tax=Legionella beliardensis TaxID=91822 RepID=A0A378JNX3_9GAMM|nr:hypothetical protein [Legionella beliardensis]STX55585.1 Uncharacterised protein [Legionella beliardensis]STX55645.1 Uncharacterised protein [Legionella beliardensis]
MGNVCAIFHERFDLLRALTSCPKKAYLLDQFIFWWQNSKFRLKDSDAIWFMRPYEDIALAVGIGLSTLKKYIKEFVDLGLIERRSTFCAKNKNNNPNEFEVKKRTYIRITDKLLGLIKQNSNVKGLTSQPAQEGNQLAPSSQLKQIETIEKSKSIPSIYKDRNYNTFTNTISEANNVNFGKESHIKSPNQVFTNDFKCEKELEAIITREATNQIKGMLFNIQHQHHLLISDPEQLFAEIVFAVTDSHQFKHCESFKHKLNAISLTLRSKRWSTPKGFYNHSCLGQLFKEKKEVKTRKRQEEKLERELLGITNPQKIAEIKARLACSEEHEMRFNVPEQAITGCSTPIANELVDKLRQINHEIHSEGCYLQMMEKDYHAGLPHASKALIDNSAIKLARLYEEQAEIEKKLATPTQDINLCA